MTNLGTLPEGSSALYIGTLIKEDGFPADMTALDSFVLSVYSSLTGAVINGRDSQNVLNANGVSVYASLQTIVIEGKTHTYNIAWQMSPADNAILTGKMLEERAGMFLATWSGGAKKWPHEVKWTVRNLAKVVDAGP
jgi:hypothetical protein